VIRSSLVNNVLSKPNAIAAHPCRSHLFFHPLTQNLSVLLRDGRDALVRDLAGFHHGADVFAPGSTIEVIATPESLEALHIAVNCVNGL